METLLVVGQLQLAGGDLAKCVEGSGFSLIETRDADEAVAICRYARPALAFVEVDSIEEVDYLGLLPRLRGALSKSGRIVAICNRYSDALDDHCEKLGANLTLPKVDVRTDFTLFLRGLMTLIPAGDEKSANLRTGDSAETADSRDLVGLLGGASLRTVGP